MLYCPVTEVVTSSIKSHNYQTGLVLAWLPQGWAEFHITILRWLRKSKPSPQSACLSPVPSRPKIQDVHTVLPGNGCYQHLTQRTLEQEGGTNLSESWRRKNWFKNASVHLSALIHRNPHAEAQGNRWTFLDRGKSGQGNSRAAPELLSQVSASIR